MYTCTESSSLCSKHTMVVDLRKDTLRLQTKRNRGDHLGKYSVDPEQHIPCPYMLLLGSLMLFFLVNHSHRKFSSTKLAVTHTSHYPPQKIKMCVTTERNSTICGHRASFTQKCKKGKSTSFLAHFRKCSPVLNTAYHHELCHDCRCFWKNYGVSEREAIERTQDYRTDHNFYAPLSPARVLRHNGKGSTDASVLPDPQRLKREENASKVTIWPNMGNAHAEGYPEILPQPLPQAHHPPGTADSNRTGFETIMVGMASNEFWGHPEDFKLGNVDRPLPLRINREDFEKRTPNFPTFRSHRSSSSAMKPELRLDLDKPLPRPPRYDSPMPGRPFDSQNPERDLPANKYYPRFI